MHTTHYYRLGIGRGNPILNMLVFTSRVKAKARAWVENRHGLYKGFGVKVFACTVDGVILR